MRTKEMKQKKLLIVQQILYISIIEIDREQYGEYFYWCWDVKS